MAIGQEIANLKVVIGADTYELSKSINDTKTKLSGFASSLSSVGRSLSLSLTAPIVGLGAASLLTFGRIDSLKKGLIAVTGSVGAAESEFKKLREVAKLPGLGLEEAVRGSVNLQAAGFSADQARKSLLSFGNALATVGKGKAELNLVVLALTQLQNKTSGFGGDLRQLTEQLPQLRGALEKVYGTSDSLEVAKLGETGAQVVQKLTAEFAKLPPVTGGLANAFENFSDSSQIALSNLGDAINKNFNIEGKLNRLADLLGGLVEKFNGLSPSMQKTILIAAGVTAAIGPLAIAIGSVAAAIPIMAAGFGGLAVLAGPVGIAIAGVTAAVAALAYAFRSNKDDFKDLVVGGSDLGKMENAITDLRKEKQALQEQIGRLSETPASQRAYTENTLVAAKERLAIVNRALEEQQKLLVKTAYAQAEANKAAQQGNDSTVRAVPYLKSLEKQIESVTAARDALTTSDPSAFAVFNKQIDDLNQKLDLLKTNIGQSIPKALPKIGLGAEIEKYNNTLAFDRKGVEPGRAPGIQTEPVSGLPQRTGNELFGISEKALDNVNEKLAEVQFNALGLQPVFESLASTMGSVFEGIGEALVGTAGGMQKAFKSIIKGIGEVIGALVNQIIATSVANALIASGAAGPFAFAIAGAAGIAAKGLITGLLSASTPSLAIGTDLVKSDGFAQIHKGEAIVPANVVAGGFTGGGGGSIIELSPNYVNVGDQLLVYLERTQSRNERRFG